MFQCPTHGGEGSTCAAVVFQCYGWPAAMSARLAGQCCFSVMADRTWLDMCSFIVSMLQPVATVAATTWLDPCNCVVSSVFQLTADMTWLDPCSHAVSVFQPPAGSTWLHQWSPVVSVFQPPADIWKNLEPQTNSTTHCCISCF